MKRLALTLIMLCFLPLALSAQEQTDDKDKEKKFYEAIETQIERLTEMLDLEGWQVFYVDSILTHDYTALQQEYEQLGKAKISNSDIYYGVQDKWMEQIYQSFNKILTEEQWAKYLKSGAARDKKARDKRAAKRQ